MLEKINFILILLLNLVSFNLNIIILPFQTYNPLLTKDQKLLNLIKRASDKDIIDTIIRNLIYVKLDIGDNKQSIPTFIEMSTKELYFKDLKIHNAKPISKKEINQNFFTYNDNSLLNNIFKLNYYNSSLSRTYKFIRSCPEYLQDYFLDKDSCANETIYLNQKLNIEDKEINKPITFYVTFKELEDDDHRPGVLGLFMVDSSFISKLKKNSEIKNYYWNIKYTNYLEEKGELIIGDLPHLYDKNNYNENDLRYDKVNLDKERLWSLNFRDIFLTKINNNKEENIYLKKNERGIFLIEEFFILGTKEYFKLIEEIFFNKYIKEGICQKQSHRKPESSTEFYHFMCNINDNKIREKFFSSFPSLTFYQKEMNCNFTFNEKDLFTIIPDGNRILFNVEFRQGEVRWTFGKPFFKKYQLIFNPDSKQISYYYVNPRIKINEEKKEKRSNFKIVIIIILIVVTFILGIFFGRVFCLRNSRKIRANELEDNYSYISKNINKEYNLEEFNLDKDKDNLVSNYKIIN